MPPSIPPNPINNLTEVRNSPVHGLGVFAKVDIPKGTVWWRANPQEDVLLINKRQFTTLLNSHHSPTSKELLEAIYTYCYYSAKDDALILILDHARYTNHSFQPNSDVIPEPGVIGSITLRDIQAGEELLEDYSEFDVCPWKGLRMKPGCRM
ncbi:MAG: SET domain-containing protein [Anaerolineae bacterium]|nr:SET domain-containing protein [Anaerolineae bacterium]